MAKASLTLPDGTKIQIDGSAEEIQKIVSLHRPSTPGEISHAKAEKKAEKKKREESDSTVDLSEIINTIKNCDEAEAIEKNILDRTSQVDRILLPLYILHKYIDDKLTLTSGDISKILGDLGISIFTPNVSRTLSDAASKYVIGDKVRQRGQAVHYKLSRRGEKYLSSVIENEDD